MNTRHLSTTNARCPLRRILRIFIVCLLAVGLFTLGSCTEKEKIKIGAVISLTGPVSSMQDVRDGMVMAVEEVNKAGGIDGAEIELRVEDSESVPAIGKAKLIELADEYEPLLLVTTSSSISVAAAPEAEKRGIPMVGLVATDPALTEGREWVYSFFPTADHEVPPIVSVLRTEGARTVGVLYLDDAYGQSVSRDMRRACNREEIEAEFISFPVGDPSLPEKVDELHRMAAVYAVGFTGDLVRIFTRLDESGYDGLKLGTSTISHPSFRRLPVAEGVYSAAPLMYNENQVFAREVQEKFENRYERPFSHYAGTGYDFVRILNGLWQGEETTRESIRRIFDRGFVYPGLFGQITLHPGERNIFFPLYAAKIVNGKLYYSR